MLAIDAGLRAVYRAKISLTKKEKPFIAGFSTTTTTKSSSGSLMKLAKISPADKTWDVRKYSNQQISQFYANNPDFIRLHQRMDECASWLFFAWIDPASVDEHDRKLKLERANFCRVRLCPVCAWRKSLALKARFLKNWENRFKAACSGLAYIHIVFTIKNPSMSQLRASIKAMNHAFKKLLKRADVIAVCKGFIKSIEVTRGQDDNPHPHFHVTMAVEPSYFNGHHYLSHVRWVELWRSCLGADYDPQVSVKRVKENRKRKSSQSADAVLDDGLAAALFETVKYSVKPSDLASAFQTKSDADQRKQKEFLYGLTEQIKFMRFLEAGGCFRGIFKDKSGADKFSDDELIQNGDSGVKTTDLRLAFDWDGKKHYRLKKS